MRLINLMLPVMNQMNIFFILYQKKMIKIFYLL